MGFGLRARRRSRGLGVSALSTTATAGHYDDCGRGDDDTAPSAEAATQCHPPDITESIHEAQYLHWVLSGVESDLNYAVVYPVRDRKIVRGREYATREEALGAAGAG